MVLTASAAFANCIIQHQLWTVNHDEHGIKTMAPGSTDQHREPDRLHTVNYRVTPAGTWNGIRREEEEETETEAEP